MGRRLTAEDLRRFALARRRLSEENASRSRERRLSADQIDRLVRRELKSGHVNEYGFIVKLGGE